MTFKRPVYPEILTNANWQRNKGMIAKMAGETRVGELMTRAKAAYDAVAWGSFDIHAVSLEGGPGVSKQTVASIDKAYKQALLEGGRVKKLNDEIRELETTAAQLAATWRNEKTIPAASAKHAQAVSDAAKTFNYATTMSTISAALDKERQESIDACKKSQATRESLEKTFKETIDKFLTRSSSVKLQDYSGFWGQCIRLPAFPIVVQNHPEFRADYDEWKKYSNQEVRPASPEALAQQIKVLTKVALSAKSKFHLLA